MRNPGKVSGPVKALTSYSFSRKNKKNKRKKKKNETKHCYLPGRSVEEQKNKLLYNPLAFFLSLDTMHTMNP